MNCILLGSNSDLAKSLTPFLEADGWTIHGWARGGVLPECKWSLVLCCIGVVEPVGKWNELDGHLFDECIDSNLMTPIRLLRAVWHNQEPDATVCFMAGSNPQRIMLGYAPYNISKMALLKAVEQIDAESDCKVFALGPGYSPTKIHRASLLAMMSGKVKNDVIERGTGMPIEWTYGALKWAIDQPKSAIGGRNVCASDPWDSDHFLAARLQQHPDFWKLRRVER